MKQLISFILLLSLFVGSSYRLRASVIHVHSCEKDSVQYAIDGASDGDTLMVAEGIATWSSCVQITKPVTVIGAGGERSKLIASGTMYELQREYGFFWIHGFTSNLPVRISGFYFEMTDWTPRYAIAAGIGDFVSCSNLRIDHNVFNHGQFPLYIGGSEGVIDHNYFFNNNISIHFTAGSTIQANASWESMDAGTAHALFIENNYFIDDEHYSGSYANEKIGTYNGGKLVIRYNYFIGNNFPLDVTYTPIMTHGSAAGGSYPAYWQSGSGARRGQSVVEIYENREEGRRIDNLAIVRGSANLIYNNSVVTPVQYSPGIALREEESENPDQWIPARTSWPGEDQVHNTFIWNNTYQGVVLDENKISHTPAEFIQKDRDYFLHSPEIIGGREYFTGAHGASGSYPTDGSIWVLPYSNGKNKPDTGSIAAGENSGSTAVVAGIHTLQGRWEDENASGVFMLRERSGTFQSENVNIQGGAARFSFVTGPGYPMPNRGTMEFTAAGPNAYYLYFPFYYPHPLTTAGNPGQVLHLSGTISPSVVELHWNAIDSVDSYSIFRDWQSAATSIEGTSWSESIPVRETVYMVYAIRSSDGKIFAAEGIRVNPSTSVAQISGLPSGCSLFQNYPNPFNPKTVISYKLKVRSEVKLTVYDILGREIAVLVNEAKNAGNYTIEWDGTNSLGQQVGSGIYFCQLKTAKFTDTKKMILVK